jgi:sRNA-binding regulator protein Hfq
MLKTHLCCIISVAVLLGILAHPVVAQERDRQPASIEKIKIDVNRLGTGEKARAKITLRNGMKLKGYVSQQGEDSFVLRDRKTDAPTTISYADVVRVERNKGHSTARNIAIGIGIGVGAFLAIIAITLAHLD